jgi:hypothetical protein
MSRLSDSAQYLLAITLLVLTTAACLLIGFANGGILLTALLGAVLLSLLALAAMMWRWQHIGNALVYRALIGFASTVAVAVVGWPAAAQTVINTVWPHLVARFSLLPQSPPVYSTVDVWPVLLFAGGFSLLVLRTLRPLDITHKTTEAIEREFPEPSFRERLQTFAGLLKDDLEARDRETNWSHAFFTPIEAEVELYGSDQKQVTDLLTALRNFRKGTAYLVIGDPGAGKSVSLRFLCRDLLKEVPRTCCVPIYVNLREWKPPTSWRDNNLPEISEVIADLHAFVVRDIAGRLDVFGREFTRKYFDRLLRAGRLFLVLDSFDEIGVLLDAEDRSPLVRLFSDAIWRFLHGIHKGRGILASRPFRRPTEEFRASARLEIRALSDARIRDFVWRRLLSDQRSTIDRLFQERPDLIAAARNPFTCALLLDYIEQHQANATPFPQTRAELYEFYTKQRITSALQYVSIRSSAEELWAVCQVLGTTMLGSATLEMARSRASALIHDEPEQKLLLLRDARLLRLGAGADGNVSFVHRRFAEYFAAVAVLKGGSFEFESIPTDSRWRDTLVIYAELCDATIAASIASRCWDEIRPFLLNPDVGTEASHRAIHSLRFIIDAFSQRREACHSFLAEFAGILETGLLKSRDLLFCKLAVEAAGVLRPQNIARILVAALEHKSDWVRDTAFRGCQGFTGKDERLQHAIIAHLFRLSFGYFVTFGREVRYSVSLSPEFRRARIIADVLFLEAWTIAIIALIGAVLAPLFKLSVLEVSPIHPIRLGGSVLIFLAMLEMTSRSSPFRVSWFAGNDVPRHALPIVCVMTFAILAPLVPLIALVVHEPAEKLLLVVSSVLVFGVLTLSSTVVRLCMDRYWRRGLLQWSAWKRLLRALKAVVPLMLGTAALGLGIYGLHQILHPIIVWIVVWIVIVLGVSPYLLEHFLDRRRLKRIRVMQSITREELASEFCLFRTAWGREEYVRKLKDADVQAIGAWPASRAPNADDKASTLLAQLEERWLGLDR